MRSNVDSTHPGKTFSIVMCTAFILLAVAIFSSAATAKECPEIPTISWWNNGSAEKMTDYVDANHSGDWAPYIRDWERYEERMRDILFRGQSAFVKSKNLVLKGADLAQYVDYIGKRIQATRCIADEVIDARLIEELNNMETAAGRDPELEIRLVE